MVISKNPLEQQLKTARGFLGEISRTELMKIRQERIVACGAFKNDCNGACSLHIKK